MVNFPFYLYFSIHEKLYREGLKEKKRRADYHDSQKELKAKLEVQKCTFSPSLSPMSRELSEKSKFAGLPIEASLNLRRKESNSKREIARRLRTMLEREACSFTPKISQTSQRISELLKENISPKNKDVFNRLNESRTRSIERDKLRQFLSSKLQIPKIYTEESNPIPESPKFLSVKEPLPKTTRLKSLKDF